MSDKEDNKFESNPPSFDDEEDNNPFPDMKGLASSMSDHRIYNEEDGKTSFRDKASSGGDKIEVDESVLLYESGTNAKGSEIITKDTFKSFQINYESRVTRLLKPKSNIKINIINAGSSNEGMVNPLKTYIVYTIQLVNQNEPADEIQTRRRYSDFESLRDILAKIHPLIIIPPIPPKNYSKLGMLNGLVSSASQQAQGSSTTGNNGTVSETSTGSSTTHLNNYSYINSTHLSKKKLIEHRKRLLSNFLNNCLNIPQIRNLEFFAKFLDPNANWSDEITLISSQLPKSIYSLNPENGLKTDPIYSSLPVPHSSRPLNVSFFRPLQDNRKQVVQKNHKKIDKEEDSTDTSSDNTTQALQDSTKTATSTSRYIIDTSQLDNFNKKIMDNFIGLANDYTELGTKFNSFSLILSESPIIRSGKSKLEDDDMKLNIMFDKIGQVFDRSFITINALIVDLETKFSEPLGEAVQYSQILYSIDKYFKRKVKQRNLVDDELQDKIRELDDLQNAENELSRIDNAVHSQAIAKDPKFDFKDVASKKTSPRNGDMQVKKGNKFKYLPTMNSFRKITQYVTEIIDQNPEETRKQKIAGVKARIEVLEKCQLIMMKDISYIADEINNNFSAFHEKELKVIYQILLRYIGFLINWAKKNVDIWEEVKEEIEKL